MLFGDGEPVQASRQGQKLKSTILPSFCGGDKAGCRVGQLDYRRADRQQGRIANDPKKLRLCGLSGVEVRDEEKAER